jgi:hypothetical protein
MKRRSFIAGLGTAAVWPCAARAQKPAPGKWRVGMPAQKRRQDVLRAGLRELGYVEGDNLVIDARSNDRTDRLAVFAAELVGLKPDVIFAVGTQAVQAVQQSTRDISHHHHYQRSRRGSSCGKSRASGRQHHRPECAFAGAERQEESAWD